MKKIITYIAALVGLGLGACSVEAPFQPDSSEGTGRLLKSTLSLEVKNVTPISRALTDGVPAVSDFKVEFFKQGDSAPVQTYDTYGSMPEVVSLPAGTYYIHVSYGGTYGNDNSNAAFNKPYYYGASDTFTVEVDKIVSNIKPITCKLQNVRVKVNFDASLVAAMTPDSKVTVQIGTGTPLDFYKDTKEDGFFEVKDNNSDLRATFIGNVEDIDVNEPKTYPKAAAGNYYVLTFKLHAADASNPGNIVPGDGENGEDSGFMVDASVGFTDLNSDDNDYDNSLNPDDPDNRYVEDDMRPENGDNPDNPGTGDNPGKDEEPKDPGTSDDNPGNEDDPSGVTIPEVVGDGVDLNKVNEINTEQDIVLKIRTKSTITTFNVYISSENQGFMDSVGELLGTELDLLGLNKNEGQGESLSKMGFPIAEDITDPQDVDENGVATIIFKLDAQLLGMLDAFDGVHTFSLVIINGMGKKQVDLKLRGHGN